VNSSRSEELTQSLVVLLLPLTHPFSSSNQQLNRYRDVVCVDNNRVSLTNGRYIHANWIDANDGERRFICTQGPLPNTVDDFWTMVLQEKIEAAVMLCDTYSISMHH
jgi:tyrosine-protein phosphatase non-receptor type 12/18/22